MRSCTNVFRLLNFILLALIPALLHGPTLVGITTALGG